MIIIYCFLFVRLDVLSHQGFRTGYLYRQPLIRAESTRARSDVELPPSATSHGTQYDEDKWLSPLRKLVQGKKTQDKLNWVNSPNTYQKVEVLETGTTDPRKITKVSVLGGEMSRKMLTILYSSPQWVQDGTSPHHSTPIKIDGNNQFVPVNGGADPNEFKKKQKQV